MSALFRPDRSCIRSVSLIQQINGISVAVELSATDGKADLNYVSGTVLTRIITAVVPDPQQAQNLSDAILDWRDPDDLVRLNGAEEKDYRAADHPFLPANRPFIHLSELQRVLGMNTAIYQKLRPLLTLHSGQSTVNQNSAGLPMLQALGLDTANYNGSFMNPGSNRIISIRALPESAESAGTELNMTLKLTPHDPDQPFQYLSWDGFEPNVPQWAGS
ncbi:type II secretion system protein GspK [Aliamphritea spongicola]|nr:type II secretion system protein GspK [Aliamphritea spongicola]